MKRKLIYSILFISLFLVSTASMAQPVHGYGVDMPKEAKGVTVESTLDAYDEDEWDKHLGAGVDREGLKAGDSDVVGAMSQYTILEWEEDDELIDYLNDYVTGPAGFRQTSEDVIGLLKSLADVNGTAGGLLDPGTAYGPYGSLAWLANYSLTTVGAMNFAGLEAIAQAAQVNASDAQLECFLAIKDYDTLMSLYSKEYDGFVLTRDHWEWEEGEFDEKADNEDNEVPFFYDPRDWRDVADSLAALEADIQADITSIQNYWADTDDTSPGWYATLAGGTHLYNATYGASAWLPYEAVNDTIYAQLDAIGDATLKGTLKSLMNVSSDVPALLGWPVPGGYGYGIGNYSTDWVLGLVGFVDVVLETVYQQVGSALPDKGGFFLAQLISGQPPASPAADFMAKVIEEYDIDDEDLSDMYKFEYGKDLDASGDISAIPYGAVSRYTGTPLGGETIYPQAYLDFSSEGEVVTVEIEWQDDYPDPKDVLKGDLDPDELEDFEIVFGDSEQWKDGDKVFWQMSGVEQIPGYEVTILLGASAISVFALVYVIMKKRKK